MADAVISRVLRNDKRIYTVQLLNLSDGTGESNVVKVDKSALLAQDAAEPARLAIAQIRWNIQGFTYIRLSFDHDTDDIVRYLSGSGYDDYGGMGYPNAPDAAYVGASGLLADPATAGGTGDLLLTTVGHSSGDTYDILMTLRLLSD